MKVNVIFLTPILRLYQNEIVERERERGRVKLNHEMKRSNCIQVLNH